MNDPSFGAALDREASGSHRRSRRDRRAPPFFNFAKRKYTQPHKTWQRSTAFVEFLPIFSSAFDFSLYI